jgi:hypothetical protein
MLSGRFLLHFCSVAEVGQTQKTVADLLALCAAFSALLHNEDAFPVDFLDNEDGGAVLLASLLVCNPPLR